MIERDSLQGGWGKDSGIFGFAVAKRLFFGFCRFVTVCRFLRFFSIRFSVFERFFGLLSNVVCIRFLVSAEFLGSFAVLDDFFSSVLRFLIYPNVPPPSGYNFVGSEGKHCNICLSSRIFGLKALAKLYRTKLDPTFQCNLGQCSNMVLNILGLIKSRI